MEHRILYLIKDVANQAWVTSSRFIHLGAFESAAIFHSERSATDAIRDMNRSFTGMCYADGKYLYTRESEQLETMASRCGMTVEDFVAQPNVAIGETPKFEVVPCVMAPRV